MLLGLSGQMGAGKDTVYELVRKELWPEIVVRDAFADRLKKSAAAALGYQDDPIGFCDMLKSHGNVRIVIENTPDLSQTRYLISLTGRKFLQQYGTEAHRDIFGQDFWIDAMALDQKLDEVLTVITDVRFPNEAKAIRSRGGMIWEIDASSRLGDRDTHSSETVLPTEYVDRYLDNNGTFDDLRASVQDASSWLQVG